MLKHLLVLFSIVGVSFCAPIYGQEKYTILPSEVKFVKHDVGKPFTTQVKAIFNIADETAGKCTTTVPYKLHILVYRGEVDKMVAASYWPDNEARCSIGLMTKSYQYEYRTEGSGWEHHFDPHKQNRCRSLDTPTNCVISWKKL